MIACLEGELFSKSPDKLIINVSGVGYEVFFPQTGFTRLPEIGEKIFLHIYTHVREDILALYGFIEAEEKQMFLLLVSVSGVGPKLALNILSGISPQDLSRAIVSENLHTLTKLPGVGKKTAERLCLELKDKVQFIPAFGQNLERNESRMDGGNQKIADVISALVNLGYTPLRAREALEIVRRKVKDDFQTMTLEELLRQALRSVG
ncbi:MAG: Holliday junction branch migration protein RuvA [Proteobacteria bacterium]|nr:Holliday junction branch migration protein RuvA [Pseudomonadota bacterium]MBU1710557.1 Holliday junction branch migration protein RuvA [Pseudomonadota bacterium]